MPPRTIALDGAEWEVSATGRTTQYLRDEFGVLFTRGTGPDRQRRVARYSPLGSRSWDTSLAELSDTQLADLFLRSQPAWTAPETGYHR